MPVHFPLKLVSSHMLAPTIRHLAFQRDDGAVLDFIPGQFIQVHFTTDGGKPSKRSYSIASLRCGPPRADSLVEVAVSFVAGGAATALFERLADGDTIEASGPYGRFCLGEQDRNERYLFVATGTGVTPYRSMLPELGRLIEARGVDVVLLFGARTPAELLYADDFRAFAAAQPRFRFVPCFSRTDPPDSEGFRGYVQHALPGVAPDAGRDIAYLCGNPDMVDACFEMLKGEGFAVPHIRREKYVSSR